MSLDSKVIWMNGEFVAHEKATIHFLTPGLHYGIGVFEGIRCYATPEGPSIFRLREHVVRLVDSAKCLGFDRLPWGVDELMEAMERLVVLNDFDECYIRPLLYLSGGGWNLVN